MSDELDFARWDGEDSTFEGFILSRYRKLSGKPMVVIEDGRGLNHIYPDNPKRLTILRRAIIADPLPKDGEAGGDFTSRDPQSIIAEKDRDISRYQDTVNEAARRIADLERERDEARGAANHNAMLYGQSKISAARLRKAVDAGIAECDRKIAVYSGDYGGWGQQLDIDKACEKTATDIKSAITAALQPEPGTDPRIEALLKDESRGTEDG